MKKTGEIMKGLCLLLAACLLLSLAGCGAKKPDAGTTPAAPELEAAPAADTAAFQTMGDVFAYDSGNFGYGDRYYVYVFEADGVNYRAVAELPADVSEALLALDIFDEGYEDQIHELVAPLAITQLDNLTEMIPSQEELDALVGKNVQELLDDGWSFWYWNMTDMEGGMYHGPFSYLMEYEGTVEDPEGFDESQAGALTVKSVTYDGIGDATADILDQAAEAYDDGFDDSPDPLANYAGEYQCDRAHMVVEARDLSEYTITIEWGDSAWSLARWVIDGFADADTMTSLYDSGEKTYVVYDENGGVESEELLSDACSGSFAFNDDGTITWHDDTSDYDEDMVFERTAAGIDYLVLVNKLHPLPDDWEDALETVTITNSVGDEVEVEAKAYAAYELLRDDLAVNDGIYLQLDSARRSVAAQEEIMERFIEKYGADYAAKTVARPGYSEHHTGLALDLYFQIQADNGEFIDVYYNEDMEKEEYLDIWEAIHAKLADYGFILRYLEGEEHITGYRYEPWHIRYVDDAEIAREIMSQPGLTLEEYLDGQSAPEVEIDLSGSALYTEEDLTDAMLAVKCQFASWAACELHAIRYAGDEANSEENIAWLNSLVDGAEYSQAAEFLLDFHTGTYGSEAWEPDTEYTDYQWWLARPTGGDWEIVSWGY